MFGVNNLLRKTDLKLAYLEQRDFLNSLSSKTDEEFVDAIEKNDKEKNELAFTYLKDKENLSDNDDVILNKYNNHILDLMNNDIKSAMNNTYFVSLLSNADINDKEILGMRVDDVIEKIYQNVDMIFAKIKNGEEISDIENEFCKNALLYAVVYHYIDNEDINEINDYFTKYKVTNFDDVKNKQLYLLGLATKYIVDIGGEVCVSFEEDEEIKNNCITSGEFGKLPDGRYVIFIYDMDLYSIKNNKEFYRKVFTVMHELGHLNQDINYNAYGEAEKHRMNIEKELINKEKEFYNQNHDNFYVEIDADMYAIDKIADDFGDVKEACSICLEKIRKVKSVLKNDSRFMMLETEKYREMKEQNKKL